MRGRGGYQIVRVPSWVGSNRDLEGDPDVILERLLSIGTVVSYDQRGLGLSDPVALNDLPTLERWTDDLHAVIDAAGAERAALYAHAIGGPICDALCSNHLVTTWWFVMFGIITSLAVAGSATVRTSPIRERLDTVSLKVLLTADLLRDAMALPLAEPDETLNHRLWWSAVYYAHRLDDHIKRRKAAFEAATLIAMGVIIGFCTLAILSATYGIYHRVKV